MRRIFSSALNRRVLLALSVGVVSVLLSADAGRAQFTGGVVRVRVDAIVTDRSGEFVDDLAFEDFQLLEDGEEQQILQMQLVDLESGRLEELTPATKRLPSREQPAYQARNASPTSGLGALVYVLDARRMGPRSRPRFARAWLEFLEEADFQAYPRAAYLLLPNGELRSVAPLTDDAELLRKVARALRETPYFEARAGTDSLVVDESEWENPEPPRPPDCPGRLNAGRATFDSLRRLAESLGRRPGRKALVWVTPGLSIHECGNRLGPRKLPVPVSHVLVADSRLGRPLREFVRTANTANVSVYAVDPTLVTWRRSISAAVGSGGPVDAVQDDPLELDLMAFDASSGTLVDVAGATAARAFPYAGDLGSALRRIVADNARFYLMTYAPPEPVGDGSYHQIEVRVKRPGVQVRAREGYADLPETVRDERAFSAALEFPELAGSFPLNGRLFRTLTPAGGSEVSLALDSPTFRDSSADAFAVRVAAMWAGGRDVHGGSVPGVETGDRAGPLFIHRWEAQPGLREVRIAVLRHLDGALGTSSVVVEPGAQEVDRESGLAPLRTSDPVPVVLGPQGRLWPMVDPVFPAGARGGVWIQVSSSGPAAAYGRVLDVDGEARGFLGRVVLRGGDGGVRQGAPALPAGLAPGSYTVELAVVADGNRRLFRVPVRISGAG